MPNVPKLWPGETVVCIGSGPSLTQADVDAVRGKARVIVVNDNYQLAPWADVLYACDEHWWNWHDGVPSFAGEKYSLMTPKRRPRAGVQCLRDTGDRGLELSPDGLRTGRHSGYQAINLAVHFGAARIVLLGYDMKMGPKGEHHWFGPHAKRPKRPPVSLFLPYYQTLVEPLRDLGISVVNCSRQTDLTVFPRQSLTEALAVAVAA